MAETLGSLIDKLSIKSLRYWHLDEDSQARDSSDPQKQELMDKMDLVDRQRKELLEEIDVFLNSALAGEVRIRDEKVKLFASSSVCEKQYVMV